MRAGGAARTVAIVRSHFSHDGEEERGMVGEADRSKEGIETGKEKRGGESKSREKRRRRQDRRRRRKITKLRCNFPSARSCLAVFPRLLGPQCPSVRHRLLRPSVLEDMCAVLTARGWHEGGRRKQDGHGKSVSLVLLAQRVVAGFVRWGTVERWMTKVENSVGGSEEDEGGGKGKGIGGGRKSWNLVVSRLLPALIAPLRNYAHQDKETSLFLLPSLQLITDVLSRLPLRDRRRGGEEEGEEGGGGGDERGGEGEEEGGGEAHHETQIKVMRPRDIRGGLEGRGDEQTLWEVISVQLIPVLRGIMSVIDRRTKGVEPGVGPGTVGNGEMLAISGATLRLIRVLAEIGFLSAHLPYSSKEEAREGGREGFGAEEEENGVLLMRRSGLLSLILSQGLPLKGEGRTTSPHALYFVSLLMIHSRWNANNSNNNDELLYHLCEDQRLVARLCVALERAAATTTESCVDDKASSGSAFSPLCSPGLLPPLLGLMHEVLFFAAAALRSLGRSRDKEGRRRDERPETIHRVRRALAMALPLVRCGHLLASPALLCHRDEGGRDEHDHHLPESAFATSVIPSTITTMTTMTTMTMASVTKHETEKAHTEQNVRRNRLNSKRRERHKNEDSVSSISSQLLLLLCQIFPSPFQQFLFGTHRDTVLVSLGFALSPHGGLSPLSELRLLQLLCFAVAPNPHSSGARRKEEEGRGSIRGGGGGGGGEEEENMMRRERRRAVLAHFPLLQALRRRKADHHSAVGYDTPIPLRSSFEEDKMIMGHHDDGDADDKRISKRGQESHDYDDDDDHHPPLAWVSAAALASDVLRWCGDDGR